MPYTVMIGDLPVLCETAAEAIELARQVAGGGISHGQSGKVDAAKSAPIAGSRWTEQRIREFFRVIKAQQRKLIEKLLETTDACTDEMLCQLLGLADGRSLAGVFTGLWKNAKRVGADPKELYVKSTASIGDRRQNEYTLAESFRTAAKKWKP